MEIWPIIELSLRVAFVAMLVAMPVALLLALLLARVHFWGKSLLQAIIFAPLILPPVVTGLVLLHLFAPNGALGAALAKIGIVFAFDWTGAALAAGVIALPLMVRPMRLSLELIDEELIESVKLAGMGPLQRFTFVLLPLSLPGLIAGMVLGFAKSMGEFGATITFVSNIPGDTQTLSLAIYNAFQNLGDDQLMWQLSLISFGLSVFALVIAEKLNQIIGRRLGLYQTQTKKNGAL